MKYAAERGEAQTGEEGACEISEGGTVGADTDHKELLAMDCCVSAHNCLSRLQVHSRHSASLKLHERKRSVGRVAHIRTQGGEASIECLNNAVDGKRTQELTLMRRTAQLLQKRDRDVVEKEWVQLVKRRTGLTIDSRKTRAHCLSTLLDLAHSRSEPRNPTWK